MAVKSEVVTAGHHFESRARRMRDSLSHYRGIVDRAYEALWDIEELAQTDEAEAIQQLEEIH